MSQNTMSKSRFPAKSLALGLLGITGLMPACSILAKEPPIEVRWFVPPLTRGDAALPQEGDEEEAGPVVQIRQVQSSRPLRDEMVWWRSDVELAFDARHKWAEDPTETVRRAVRTRLAVAGLRVGTRPGLPSVQVEVTRFGGRFDGNGSVAEVTLTITLEGRAEPRHERIAVEEALVDDSPESLARGVGAALDRAAQQAAEAIAAWIS